MSKKWICAVVYSMEKVFWCLKVIGENTKSCKNKLATILSEKKKLRFLRSEISKLRDFICPKCPKNGFPPTSRRCKKFFGGAMKTNKIPVKPET